MDFFRMQSISLNVSEIIEAIDGARNHTERCKHHERGPKIVGLQQIVAEEDRRKDEYVFDPLQWPEQLNVVYHRCKDSANRAKCKINHDLFSFPRCSLSSNFIQRYD